MPRRPPRHDREAGGARDVLAAKAALREEVWAALTAARVARFPGAAGRIPNFTGAEASAERGRADRGQGHGDPAAHGAPAAPAGPATPLSGLRPGCRAASGRAADLEDRVVGRDPAQLGI